MHRKTHPPASCVESAHHSMHGQRTMRKRFHAMAHPHLPTGSVSPAQTDPCLCHSSTPTAAAGPLSCPLPLPPPAEAAGAGGGAGLRASYARMSGATCVSASLYSQSSVTAPTALRRSASVRGTAAPVLTMHRLQADAGTTYTHHTNTHPESMLVSCAVTHITTAVNQ